LVCAGIVTVGEIAGRYLRREKELAEARLEVNSAETNRLRQQVLNLKKQVDAAEQALAEERQKTEVFDPFFFKLLIKVCNSSSSATA